MSAIEDDDFEDNLGSEDEVELDYNDQDIKVLQIAMVEAISSMLFFFKHLI